MLSIALKSSFDTEHIAFFRPFIPCSFSTKHCGVWFTLHPSRKSFIKNRDCPLFICKLSYAMCRMDMLING